MQCSHDSREIIALSRIADLRQIIALSTQESHNEAKKKADRY